MAAVDLQELLRFVGYLKQALTVLVRDNPIVRAVDNEQRNVDIWQSRRGIILKTPSALFVAPDNGILSYVIDDLFLVDNQSLTEHTQGLKEIIFKTGLEAIAITDPRF